MNFFAPKLLYNNNNMIYGDRIRIKYELLTKSFLFFSSISPDLLMSINPKVPSMSTVSKI
jgi:hypothetical protein